MKGLILSGGKGSRLRPVTHTLPKQLIPVANKPVLFYAIESLRDAGITGIGIVVGENKNEVIKMVGDGSRWGIHVTYIEQEAPLGLAHAVKISESFIGNEPFIMFLGDNLLQQGVSTLIKKFQKDRPHSLVLLGEVEEPRYFGVAELKNGKIIRLVEKPQFPPSNLALVGVYLFDQNIFQAVHSIRPSWRNELEITDAIQWMVENGYEVHPHLLTGWWKDTGKPEDVLEANRLVLETITTKIEGSVSSDSRVIGPLVIEPGAKVVNSVIRGPAVIGKDCTIINSCIGPFLSVSDEVTVNNSEIENSIVLPCSTISGVPLRIDKSLIGRNVKVNARPKRQNAINLILGDTCQVYVT
ncbi:MAG: glucose-1-phosphate thymidylyltransferase [Clostridiales bacterium]|nr:glucose-1-phosphate thymidylyltransferase [Clostridiales bacterium]MCF8022844.1 glucose-1-phosphate thymidylyltransferase [Clostridiales bacterium]